MQRVLLGALVAVLTTHSALADEQPVPKGPRLEVVVQSGLRGDANRCPPSTNGAAPDEICFFDWDTPLANLKVKLPMRSGDKCVPHKEKLTDGLDLEVGCASLVKDQAGGKDLHAYTFTMTLREAAPKPNMQPKAHVVTVPKLKPSVLWQVGGFKDRRRSTKGGQGEKPKRAAFLIKLKLAE